MKHSYHNLLAGIILFFAASCSVPDNQPVSTQPVNKFSDSTILNIYALQDERKSQAIASYFTSENPAYRKEAAMAMASVQDPGMIPFLAVLLDDANSQVRSSAAYALGQTYDSAALPFLAKAMLEEDSAVVVREIVESIGKVITQDSIEILHSIQPENDLEKEGFSWALYRAGLRNVHDPETVNRAVRLLDTGNTYKTRLGAAHFLARTRNISLDRHINQLSKSATQDPAPDVRMAIASALSKITTRRSFTLLSESLVDDGDYRVRINAIRALGAHSTWTLADTAYFINALADENINVQVASAETLAGVEGLDPVSMVQEAQKHPDARVKGILFTAAVNNGKDYPDAVEAIKAAYDSASDPYYKAALLSSLAHAPVAYDFIVTQIFKDVHPAVSTAGISALAEMRSMEQFPESLKQPMADVLRDVMKSGDIGLIYVGAQMLSNESYNFKESYEDISFLYESKETLSLPKDNEALQVLNKTIAYFESTDSDPVTENPYNHPIDWEYVKSIPKDLEVQVKTEKGTITFRMKVENSPGSVANFLTLAGSGYYDGISFHRVVPNFVVQGGCPRGDGFGGEDYSIRSEFSDLRYTEGSVGMASAGKDTEGTQWFITHSPTPHLDGRYTIFAQVTKGMDVAHTLEVGDKIETVTIPNF